jgi:predicted NUDIX family phosphoesterase
LINVDDSEDARHHVAVLTVFQHKKAALPKKGELSINQLSWLDLNQRKNDLSDYDLWSEMIIRNIYAGKIAL